MTTPTYHDIATKLAALVETKQAAYGDSFGKAGAVMRILYPDGIPLEKLDDALTVVRIIDKQFRIATRKDALGESPWEDIMGYALLAVRRDAEAKAKAKAAESASTDDAALDARVVLLDRLAAAVGGATWHDAVDRVEKLYCPAP